MMMSSSHKDFVLALQILQFILITHLCCPIELPHKLDVEPLRRFKGYCAVVFSKFNSHLKDIDCTVTLFTCHCYC